MFWRFLMVIRTWALSSVATIAMSVRILHTSHDRCWTVGSLPYLLCHLATWQPKTDQRTWPPIMIGTIPAGDTKRRRRLGQALHGHMGPRRLC
jgi:hypothetical protein